MRSDALAQDRDRLRRHWHAAGYYRAHSVVGEMDRHEAAFADVELHFHGPDTMRRSTLGEIAADSRRLAAALAGLGIGRGDVVALQLPSAYETAVLYQAVLRAGAVLLPIVHIYGPAELGFILRQSGAKAFICPDRWRKIDFLQRLATLDAGPALQHVIVLGEEAPAGALRYRELAAAATDVPLSPAAGDDLAVLLYTSGTTAAPKGVRLTHNNLIAEWYGPMYVDRGTCLCTFPAGHIAGLNYLLRPTVNGIPSVFLDQWDAELAASLMERHQVSQSGGTPHALLTLDEATRGRRHLLASLRWFPMGGANVTPSHIELAADMGFAAGRVYGLTEHSTVTQSGPDLPFAKRACTDGMVAPGNQVRIVDDRGCDVDIGAEGEILTLGPELCSGYTDPAVDAEGFLPGGWFKTGDIGRLDGDGCLTITDRKKDIIIRGGENISSKEVEDILARHPAVIEAAAVAMPDVRYGEKVCAFVIAKPGHRFDLETVRAHFIANGAARQKTPEHIVLVEELPRTPSGKVKKFELKAQLARH